MELNLSWGELARSCGGLLVRGLAEDRVSSISIDTRRLDDAQVFWALKGLRTDGHDHLDRAGRAAGWVIRKGHDRIATAPAHLVEAPDTLKALQSLAAFHRRRFDIQVAAVAGSNGKTSTKEMLRCICAQEGPVCATQGNLNNQFGLPLSVLEMTPGHRYAVFELGESRPGDIDELTRIAQPTVAVLTNVQPAHLEFLGDLEGVFKCLTELVTAGPSSTRVAVNLDDARLAGLEAGLGPRAVTFGAHERAAVRLLPGAPGSVELVVNRLRVSARLAAPGRVHRLNACAAAAGAVGMGLGPEAIVRGLEAFRPAPMRFEPVRHKSGAWLVLDAYNANPGSMREGIDSFCESFPKERRVVVLGDMKELGAESPKLHRELGEWLARRKVSAVFLAGTDMEAAASALRAAPGLEVHHAADFSVWAPTLRSMLSPDAAVFFKASRAMRFEALIESL